MFSDVYYIETATENYINIFLSFFVVAVSKLYESTSSTLIFFCHLTAFVVLIKLI